MELVSIFNAIDVISLETMAQDVVAAMAPVFQVDASGLSCLHQRVPKQVRILCRLDASSRQ